MFRKLTTVVFLLTAVNAFAHGNLKLVNGLWFDGASFQPKTMYSVENVFRTSFDGETRTVDLGGRYVIPPLADAHNHVLADSGRSDEELARYLRAGIFYVKNPNNSASLSAAARAKMNTPETVDVLYANGGVTRSGGHPSQIYAPLGEKFADAWFTADSVASIEAVWPGIRAGRPDFLKIYFEQTESPGKRRGLTPEVARALVERAHRHGLRVSAHVTTTADFHEAVAAGVDEITHLPLAPIAETDARAVAAKGITVVTTTLSHRPTEGVADLAALHRANLSLLRRAGVTVLLGVDDGRPTVIDEIENVDALGVYTRAELLRMAVETTPRAIFPSRRIGRLEEGAEASLLAVDGNPLEDLRALRRVWLRVKQGHVLEIAPEKPSIAEALMPLMMSKGAEAAIAEYRRLLNEEPDKWDAREPRLNQLGYALLNHGRNADAIAIFQLNAERFPRSANVWDSLAEAYLRDGKREQAIANYRKALELDPKSENAKKMLEGLLKE